MLVLVFAVNTVALSAYANACQMNAPQVVSEQASADMPDCHKKMEQEEKQSSTHCEGVCFCKHVLINSHFLTAPDIDLAVFSTKELRVQAVDEYGIAIAAAPLFRPPITIS